jgi:hypothetical protein
MVIKIESRAITGWTTDVISYGVPYIIKGVIAASQLMPAVLM